MHLQTETADAIEARLDSIANDAGAVFPFDPSETLDVRSGDQLSHTVLQLLTTAIRGGELDYRQGAVADLRAFVDEARLSVQQLTALVYLLERAALDELALHETLGATSDSWPAVALMVRRGSFDILAAYGERIRREPGKDALIDHLTTLHTRAVLLAVLEKELHRAERFRRPFALIVFDVDRLSAINAAHGFRFGDRVLERIGIVVRNYFREQDWVARCAEDAFAVLLPETQREHAESLAERVRATVEERLALPDYRNDDQVPITISVAVLMVEAVDASVGVDDMMRQAEQAVQRAKQDGGNRVEPVVIHVERPAVPVRDAQAL